MAKKDKYIRFSGISLSGSLDIKDDKIIVITEDTEVELFSILEENAGCYIKIDMSVTEEIAE